MAARDGFGAPYWSLAQVLAWVCFRERRVVERFGVSPDEAPSSAEIAVEVSLKHGPEGSAYLNSKKDAILGHLQRGKLIATGIPVGGGERAEIPALQWIDLGLFYDPDRAMARNAQGVLEARWTNLQFAREAVLKLWPESRVHASHGPPPDIKRRELLAWMKHDVWTAAEALLLLHGKEPVFPWTEDHELTTHFVQAKMYLNRALQSGVVGRQTVVDGQKQWIDSPGNWYLWAEGKFVVDTRVKNAFDLRRFGTGPRVHFLQAKDLLFKSVGDYLVEEVAMWLFHDELFAWFSDEQDADQFHFGVWLPSDGLEYLSKLTDIYFSREQLESFSPKERWLTYQDLRTRWAERMSEGEATTMIGSRIGSGDLVPSHPIAGLGTDDGEPGYEDCLFALSEIATVERKVGLAGIRTVDDERAGRQKMGTVAAESKCRDWLIREMEKHSEPQQSKAKYREQLRNQIPGLTVRGFDRAWGDAVRVTGKANWSSPGRKSKHRIDTPKKS